jgi:hypothetical protein
MARFGIDYATLRSKFPALTLCWGVIGMTNKQPPDDVSISKFDILATYAYAKALLDGMDDDEAKQQGMVAAIMSAQARLGIRKEHHEEFQAQKEAAEKKKKTTITAESFDKQVANKMGKFCDDVFLPNLKKLVEAGVSYDDVKRLVKIPSTWGARISGEQFEDRVTAYFSK